MKDQLQPSQELEAAKEAYKDAVSDEFHARGLQGISVLLIEQAGGVPFLEAQVDDYDGEIEIPQELKPIFAIIFRDTRVLLESASFSSDTGVLIFESYLTKDSDEDGIHVKGNLRADPEIDFDISGQKISYSLFPKRQNQDTITPTEQPMTAQALQGLTRLVQNIGKRSGSVITIYRADFESDPTSQA